MNQFLVCHSIVPPLPLKSYLTCIGWLSPVLLGPKSKEEAINGILEPLSSAACNAHLVLFILDAVLVQIVPELGNLTDVNLVEPYTSTAVNKDEKTDVRLQDPKRSVPTDSIKPS